MPKRVATMKDLNELSEAVSNVIRETGDQLRETRRFIAGVDETISSRLAVVEGMVNALEDQEFSGIYDRLAALERQVAGSDCEPARWTGDPRPADPGGLRWMAHQALLRNRIVV